MCKIAENTTPAEVKGYKYRLCRKDYLNADGSFNFRSCMEAIMNRIDEGSTGRVGIACEGAIRLWLAKDKYACVYRVQPENKADAKFLAYDENGARRYESLEIKTVCGELNNIHRSKTIAYCMEVDFSDLEHLPEQFAVFSTADFWGRLEAWETVRKDYHGTGKILRYDRGRNTVHIQSFRAPTRPHASVPIREYLLDICAEVPTLGEYVRTKRGQA